MPHTMTAVKTYTQIAAVTLKYTHRLDRRLVGDDSTSWSNIEITSGYRDGSER
jgi:hypothetical protein